MGDRPEDSIVRKAAAGDLDAFRSLVEEHQARVYSMVLRRVGDREAAEDLTQETFVRAYRKLSSFEFRSSFGTWIVRIALNLASNHLSSVVSRTAAAAVPFDEALHGAADDEGAAIEERLSLLRVCLEKLSDRYHEVVMFCSIERNSYQDAAAILDIPLGTVASRMNTAFRLLRECINRRLA